MTATRQSSQNQKGNPQIADGTAFTLVMIADAVEALQKELSASIWSLSSK
jgi:hypothetical protein